MTDSLKTGTSELAQYNSDLVPIQEVRSEKGGMKPAHLKRLDYLASGGPDMNLRAL